MNKKTILVTGGNKGIGFEVARQLGKLGQKVILTARDESRGKAAVQKLQQEKLSVTFLPLDITNSDSINFCFKEVKNTFGRLDVLINNAAVLVKSDLSLLTNDLAITAETINANALSQLQVTRTFLPLVPKGGRIIMTSSGGGSMSDAVGGWSPAYCVSKSLLNAMTRHLAYELSSKDISINAYDPGWVRTDMGGHSAPGDIKDGADTAVWLATSEKIPSGRFFYNRKEIPW